MTIWSLLTLKSIHDIYPAMIEPEHPNRMERRRQQTHDALVAAAREVFAARGVDASTISDITEAADVAKGSFYNHFDAKDDVLRTVVATTLADLGDALDRMTEPLREDPARVIAVCLRHTLRACVKDPVVGWFLLRAGEALSVGEAAIGPFGRRDIGRGVASGRFRVDDAELAGTMIGGAMQAVLRRRLRGELEPSADESLTFHALRVLGVPAEEARSIATEDLPPLDDAHEARAITQEASP
jgi:AcrR family transcriptional regulator